MVDTSVSMRKRYRQINLTIAGMESARDRYQERLEQVQGYRVITEAQLVDVRDTMATYDIAHGNIHSLVSVPGESNTALRIMARKVQRKINDLKSREKFYKRLIERHDIEEQTCLKRIAELSKSIEKWLDSAVSSKK